jgi:hypothetical protein
MMYCALPAGKAALRKYSICIFIPREGMYYNKVSIRVYRCGAHAGWIEKCLSCGVVEYMNMELEELGGLRGLDLW